MFILICEETENCNTKVHLAQFYSGFLQVRENWKRSGNLTGQGKSGKMQK